MSSLRLEERRGPAVAALANDWGELSTRDPRATPFQRPEWLVPYCHAFGVDDPWAVAMWQGPRLAALATLVIFEERGRRVATLLGAGRSDWQDVLVDPELAPEGARLLLERIADRRAAYDELLLERLPVDGWLARAAAPSTLRLNAASDDEPCPAVELPGKVEALAGCVAPHVLENVRQGERRLARAGEVAVVDVSAGGVDRHVEAFLALHAARWAARGEGGLLAEAPVRRFHIEATRALAGAGLLRGYRLVVGGRDVAVWHGFQLHRRWFYYLGGFDPAQSRASPGTVLLWRAAEAAIGSGARTLDLLRGREPYKYAWGGRDQAALRRCWCVGGEKGNRVQS